MTFLTSTSDHVCVIEVHPDLNGSLANLAHPTSAAEQTKWDASEHCKISLVLDPVDLNPDAIPSLPFIG
jgi:hypothetical protein